MVRASFRKNFTLCDMDTFCYNLVIVTEIYLGIKTLQNQFYFFLVVWLHDAVIFFSQCVFLVMSTK